jgi:DNA-binding PadR family transcriptional regulator
MRDLTVLEQLILASILSLEGDAYGVSIRKHIRAKTNKVLMYGTLYRALDQLTRKIYVTKSKGNATADRDGSKKVYYTVTEKGKEALEAAFRLQRDIKDIIPDFTFDRTDA